MKKLLNISVIAALAVLPVAANADAGDQVAKINAAAVTATEAIATTSYVKGAHKDLADKIDAFIDSTSIATPGNYIDSGKDVAHNLVELDTQAKANADAIAGWTSGNNSITNQIQTQAQNANFTATSEMTANTIAGAINELDGEVDTLQGQMGDTALANTFDSATTVTAAVNELESDKQEKSDSQVTTAGNYLTTGYGVGANLQALDTAVGKVGTGTHNTGIDAENSVAANLEALDTAIGNINTASGSLAADGHYIQRANSVSQNLSALDGQVYTNTGDISTINNKAIVVSTTWGNDSVTAQKKISELPAYVAPSQPQQPSQGD